jgi:hypothetical protein
MLFDLRFRDEDAFLILAMVSLGTSGEPAEKILFFVSNSTV